VLAGEKPPRLNAAIVGLLALLLLLLSLVLSPERYVLAPLALLSGFAFTRIPAAGLALVAFVPYAIFANLEGIVHGSGKLYPSEVIVLAALAVIAFREPHWWRGGGISRWAVGFGLWMAVAALAARAETDSAGIARFLRMGFLSAACCALGQEAARRGRGARIGIDAALGAAALMAALALAGAILAVVRRPGEVPSVGGAAGSAEMLAIHLTLLAPPGLALAVCGRDSSRATRVLLALIGLAILATFSRAGWAGSWAAILGMGVLGRKVDPRGSRRLLVLAGGVVGCAALGAAVLVLAPGPLAGLGHRLRELTPAALLTSRQSDWLTGIKTIAMHPLFGQPDAPNPYNLILGLASTSGWPILLLFGAVVVAAVRSGWRAIGRGSFGPEAVGLMGALVGFLVTGIGESSLGARLVPPTFLLLGLLGGLGDAKPRPTREAPLDG